MRPTPPRIINAKGNRSFGGSQMWFENKVMLNSGCGIVAGYDAVMRLLDEDEFSKDDYMAALNEAITFQTTAYNDAVSHSVTPEPDTVISVNMLWYASSEYVEIEPQDLTEINPALDEREGFVFIEWGGEETDEF